MSEEMVERVAQAIAKKGFGRPWDDFEELNAFDTDQNDLRDYAQAAIDAIRAETPQSIPSGERETWLPISTAPKEGLIDIWFVRSDGSGERRVDSYYDNICGEWRTSRPGGLLVCIKERHVTHWRYPPNDPAALSEAPRASQEDVQ
jgi:hypothetical protein